MAPPRYTRRLSVDCLKNPTRGAAILQPEDYDVFAALDGLVAGRHQALLPQQKLDLIREITNS